MKKATLLMLAALALMCVFTTGCGTNDEGAAIDALMKLKIAVTGPTGFAEEEDVVPMIKGLNESLAYTFIYTKYDRGFECYVMPDDPQYRTFYTCEDTQLRSKKGRHDSGAEDWEPHGWKVFY